MKCLQTPAVTRVLGLWWALKPLTHRQPGQAAPSGLCPGLVHHRLLRCSQGDAAGQQRGDKCRNRARFFREEDVGMKTRGVSCLQPCPPGRAPGRGRSQLIQDGGGQDRATQTPVPSFTPKIQRPGAACRDRYRRTSTRRGPSGATTHPHACTSIHRKCIHIHIYDLLAIYPRDRCWGSAGTRTRDLRTAPRTTAPRRQRPRN